MNRIAVKVLALIISSLVVAGCSATPQASQLRNTIPQSATGSLPSMFETSGAPSVTSPAVIAVNNNLGALEYWPMRSGGDNIPIRISKKGLFIGAGLVANGRVVSFGNQDPAEVVQFNVDTKALTTLPDPYGTPIDIAIGKDNSLYVLNLVRSNPANVAWYPGGAPNPKELACSALDYGSNVAVDNEGNLYVGGYIGQDTAGIIKFPNGPNGPDPSQCKTLDLGLGSAYMDGVVVDPKTDDLVTLTNPDLCAGGVEGLMTIFPKPYRRETGRSHVVGHNCSFGLRLSADSKKVFVLDESVDGGTSYVLQRSFPDGVPEGTYHGGQPTSITTIPNALPN
jgi:hypothetical protein